MTRNQKRLALIAFLFVFGACVVILLRSVTAWSLRPPSSGTDSPPRPTDLTPEFVAQCAHFPGKLIVEPPTDLFDVDAHNPATIFNRTFVRSTKPHLDIVNLSAYRGHSCFEESLESWFISNLGTDVKQGPSAKDMRSYLRTKWQESQSTVRIRSGKQVQIRAMGLGLGGIARWATLESPNGQFALTVEATRYASDYPLNTDERAAVESLAGDKGIADLLTCIHTKLWP